MVLEAVRTTLKNRPSRWFITGVAGFIGSHLLEELLRCDQEVVGIDNLATGLRQNLDQVRERVSAEQWKRFRWREVDLLTPELWSADLQGCSYVLHQAALGSVPRSLKDPIGTHATNVTGFLNVLTAAQQAEGVRRFVYASSSSVYGDNQTLPKDEDRTGNPLSPYAATKVMNEVYASVFSQCYGMKVTGLRYFNVFGPRQRPDGPYAAVIPRWIHQIREGERVVIYGDGLTSRDFCYVENVVQANLLAALDEKSNQAVFNVACGSKTTLSDLFVLIRDLVAQKIPERASMEAHHEDFRAGDILHSLASLKKIEGALGYRPQFDIAQGLQKTIANLGNAS